MGFDASRIQFRDRVSYNNEIFVYKHLIKTYLSTRMAQEGWHHHLICAGLYRVSLDSVRPLLVNKNGPKRNEEGFITASCRRIHATTNGLKQYQAIFFNRS
ncbi:hypothetical protein AB6A40_005147 [Gnathostoma spinigerum]|uniref:Uncharacterized protein n=1 Tax=Gnathostoma spinigerum TaxID=75299 RepID=A0ABD6EER3_9BILA